MQPIRRTNTYKTHHLVLGGLRKTQNDCQVIIVDGSAYVSGDESYARIDNAGLRCLILTIEERNIR